MVNAYGGDMISLGADGFIWSGRMSVTLWGPAANEAGTVHVGRMKLGTLFQLGSIGIDQLIKVSDTVSFDRHKPMIMNVAVNNTNVFF